MLDRMKVERFKSWKETREIRLAPLTALFGTNSSGKTSLLQLLLMLKQTVESTDRSQVLDLGDERSLVELGTFQDVIHRHDLGAELAWELGWTLPERLSVQDPASPKNSLFSDDRMLFSATLSWLARGSGLGRAAIRQMSYRFGDADFGMRATNPARQEYDLFETRGDFKFVRTPGRRWKLPPPAKFYGFPDQVRAYYQNAGFLADFELQFEQFFSRMFYLGPLRDYPKRQYTWGGSRPSDMGRRGENVVDALLASAEAGEVIRYGRGRKNMTLQERVAAWLKELGLIDRFEVRPLSKGGKLFQVWITRQPGAAEALITDVGFGVSQILPVIALCYYVPMGSVVVLEQPEIHLHPAVQAGLADVFIDAVKTRQIQLIIESHSEHLLRRLQRRVAEEQIQADQAALYFTQTRAGESELMPLELDMFGMIQNWPAGFFGDEMGEIAATQKAIMERKMRLAS
jgi:predicted ATPase